MYINLDQGPVANAAEAMDLPGLDDKNITGAGFEFLPVDRPETPAFPDELDLIVRMTMGPGTTPGEGAEEENGDIDVAVLGSNEVVRAALKWQVLLTDTVHPACAPVEMGSPRAKYETHECYQPRASLPLGRAQASRSAGAPLLFVPAEETGPPASSTL
jgi:hypothetical protein